jgi:hypothetical protein
MLPSRSFSSLWRADGSMVERSIRTVSGVKPAYSKNDYFLHEPRS